MFLFTVHDAAGNKHHVNGNNVAWFARDLPGKGTAIAMTVPGVGGGCVMLKVVEAPDEIATLIAAKLRK